jgi:hypothetical protein
MINGLRPNLSDIGPKKSCPIAKAIRKYDRVRPRSRMETLRSAAMVGKDGSMIVVDNVPMADSTASKTTVRVPAFPVTAVESC